jgi:hypothetical protein
MKENNELPHIKADDSLGMRVIQSGSGYSVEITYGGQAVAHHNSGGEFDLFIENDDRQYNLSFNSLSLPEYRVEGNKIILSGKFPMETFISYLWVRVERAYQETDIPFPKKPASALLYLKKQLGTY